MHSSPNSSFSKYIVYVDESGDNSLSHIDSNYPLFVLAFCIFHKEHYSEKVVSSLEKFKFKHFGHDQIILHEHEIRKEKGRFNIFKNREEKTLFIDDLTTIIQESNFILIACVINKYELTKSMIENKNAYHIALDICMEKLYKFLLEKKQNLLPTHIVVECRGKKEDCELELEFRRICDGNNSLNIPMPFEIIFSDKKAMSSGLQLADLVARPIGVKTLKPTQENHAFEVLKTKLYCEGGRSKLGEEYNGYGLVVYPES